MCKRCGYVWKYAGKYVRKGRGVISCSYCKTTMELAQALERGKGKPVSIDRDYKVPLRLKVQRQVEVNKRKIRKMEEEKK